MEIWFWIRGWFLSFLTSLEMDLQFSWSAGDEISAPKPTRLFFLSPWRISVLVWALFLLCFSATWQTPASGLNIGSRGRENSIRWLFSYTFVVSLCGLVLDRFIAMVHPLKYIFLMTRCHIIQVIFFSWTATFHYVVLQFSLRVSLKMRLVTALFGW